MNSSSVIRVMIVDDSVLVRGLLRNIVEKHPRLEIVASCADGEAALEDYATCKPDIVLLDVEMPYMDGLTTLRILLERDPEAHVIMCSSLTQAGAETTYKALDIGALDCLGKPSAQTIDRGEGFADQLCRMLVSLGEQGDRAALPAALGEKASDIRLRPYPSRFPTSFPLALAIGASTGGPQALPHFFKALNSHLMLPVFVTQHMPSGFADLMAESIRKQAGMPTHVAQDGMLVEPGHIYLAPAGRHMGITKAGMCKITLMDTAPVNFCKPSINVMLDSLRETYGDNILTVMMTGMGMDGKDACKRLAESGTHNVILAQDRESSAIWGIPGAIATEGLCNDVLPLNEIGPVVNRLIKREVMAV